MLHHRTEHNLGDASKEPVGAARQCQGEALIFCSCRHRWSRRKSIVGDEWLSERVKDSMFPSSRLQCSSHWQIEWFICVSLPQRGTYLPQTYIIQEEMMVTGRVRNMRQLGPFIHRLCYGKETYRLRRRNQRRRKYKCVMLHNKRWVLGHFRWFITLFHTNSHEMLSHVTCAGSLRSLPALKEESIPPVSHREIRCSLLVCRSKQRVSDHAEPNRGFLMNISDRQCLCSVKSSSNSLEAWLSCQCMCVCGHSLGTSCCVSHS